MSEHPDRFTTAMRKAGREQKILIDYFRNNRGSTSVAAYSTRARPGLPVSLAISWEELGSFLPERPFTMASPPRSSRGAAAPPPRELSDRLTSYHSECTTGAPCTVVTLTLFSHAAIAGNSSQDAVCFQ